MNPLTQLLKKELVCALGCTEPIAIALASAKAREILGGLPKETIVRCSGNIIKNVKGVTVPNTHGLKGVKAATAIGLIAGEAHKGLEVLSKVNDYDIACAKEMLKENQIKVELKEGVENLDIEIWVRDDQGNDCLVEIQNKHTNFFRMIKNGKFIYQGKLVEDQQDQYLEQLSIHSSVQYAQTKRNAELNHLDNCHFECADAADGLYKIAKKQKIDTLLIDPPRSGLDEAMLEAILKSQPDRIIYISCNPATLAKNIAVLKWKYQILTIQAFDLFPQTPHVECLCLLSKVQK